MLKLAFNQDLDKNSQWHFIPAAFTDLSCTSLDNAKVSNYFTPTPTQPTVGTQHSQSPQTALAATFQGHLLQGVAAEQPALYKAICYRSEDKPGNVQLVVSQRVGRCVDWRKDLGWKRWEGHVGTIGKYRMIQSALHE